METNRTKPAAMFQRRRALSLSRKNDINKLTFQGFQEEMEKQGIVCAPFPRSLSESERGKRERERAIEEERPRSDVKRFRETLAQRVFPSRYKVRVPLTHASLREFSLPGKGKRQDSATKRHPCPVDGCLSSIFSAVSRPAMSQLKILYLAITTPSRNFPSPNLSSKLGVHIFTLSKSRKIHSPYSLCNKNPVQPLPKNKFYEFLRFFKVYIFSQKPKKEKGTKQTLQNQ